jgi:hypothetical protein
MDFTPKPFYHTMNPFEQLAQDYQIVQIQVGELERVILTKDEEIGEKKISNQSAIRYITSLEDKIIKLGDEVATVKSTNLSLEERLKKYESKFGKLE